MAQRACLFNQMQSLFSVPSLLMNRCVVFPNTIARARATATREPHRAPPQLQPARGAVTILRPPRQRSTGAGRSSDSPAGVRVRTRLGSFISEALTTETRRETHRKDSAMSEILRGREIVAMRLPGRQDRSGGANHSEKTGGWRRSMHSTRRAHG